MTSDPVVIVALARTPMGSFNGELRKSSAAELGAIAIRAAVERSKVTSNKIEEVIMGCVLPAGQGQAPARQAFLCGDAGPRAAGGPRQRRHARSREPYRAVREGTCA